MSHLIEFLSDAIVWYTLAVVIFLFVLVRFGGKPIVAAIDEEIEKVRRSLDDANASRAKSEALLNEYREKQKAAMADVAAIVEHAKIEAERLRVKAESDMHAALERQNQSASNRIRRAEEEAVADVRSITIDLAMQAARKTLSERLDRATADSLVDAAISDVSRLKKASAA